MLKSHLRDAKFILVDIQAEREPLMKRARRCNRTLPILMTVLTIALTSGSLFSAEKGKNEYKAQVGKPGGSLIISTIAPPKSFNPILAKETSTTAVTGLIFEGLTRTNGVTTEVGPSLAQSWEVSEDGKTWTLHLRRDIFWNDGRPFTADDVVFTFQKLIYNQNIPSSARDIFTIEGKQINVSKVDANTVTFTLPVKFAPFLRSLEQEILPKHALEKLVDEGKFNNAWSVNTPPEKIVGTGPFMLQQYVPGQRVVFKRNPHYWRKDEKSNPLPYLAGITHIVVQNQDVELLKFQSKETDYLGMRGSDFPILKPNEQRDNFTVYNVGPAFGTNFIAFNQNPGRNPQTEEPYVPPHKLKWFTDIRFRRAVAHAIDKQSIINIVMNGLGFPQYAAMSPAAKLFYSANVQKYDYNPQKSKDLLKEAGFKDTNGDGVLEDSAGHPLEFNLFTNSENTERIKIAGIIRKDLEEVGMKVNFTPLEFNNLVSKLSSNYQWDAIILGLTGGIEPHFGKNVWHSTGHLHVWNPLQKKPATAWEKRMDEIFDQAVQELDVEKRRKLYDEWQLIVSEQLPLIYTVLPASLHAVRNKFGNLYPTAYGGTFHNLEEIFVK